MGSGSLLSWLLMPVRLAMPVAFWALTAAPSYYETSQAASLEVALYSPDKGKPSGLASKLFEQTNYRPVIDTAVEDIYLALSNHELNKALKLTDRLLEEFPNF